MKMIYVTDIVNNNKVAINTRNVIAIFKIIDGEHIGKTCVTLTSGHIYTAEEDYDLVAQINNG